MSIEQLLETTAQAIREEFATRPGPTPTTLRRKHRQRSRRRIASTLVVAVMIAGAAGAVYMNREGSTLDTSNSPANPTPTAASPSSPPQDPAAAPDPTPTAAAPSSPPQDPAAAPDPTRTVLASPVGREMPRYLRIWNRTETNDRTDVALSEQWFEPDGYAYGNFAEIADIGPDVGAWQDLAEVPDSAETIQEQGDDRNLGYPEQHLPRTASALEDLLAHPDGPGAISPGVFITVSSLGGDGSYLPETATTVRELVRLLPTIMEANHRQIVFEVMLGLDEAEVQQEVEDLLGRSSTMVTIPLPVTDPADGTRLGRLQASFWIDPSTHAVHQIEWRLVDGVLGGSDLSLFVDTTVIIAAGEVTTIPELVIEPRDPTQPTATTISPSQADQIFREAFACLGSIDPLSEPPPDPDVFNAQAVKIDGFRLDPQTGRPTISVLSTSADPNAVGLLADRCSERHGVDIAVAHLTP